MKLAKAIPTLDPDSALETSLTNSGNVMIKPTVPANAAPTPIPRSTIRGKFRSPDVS